MSDDSPPDLPPRFASDLFRAVVILAVLVDVVIIVAHAVIRWLVL